MRRAILALAGVVLAGSAQWAQTTSVMNPNPLETAQELFEAKQYNAVIMRLNGQAIGSLSKQYRPQAYLLLGSSYSRQKKIDRALGVLQLGAQLFPDDLNLLSELANVLHQEELDDRAKPLYERCLHIHPNNATAHLGLAEIEHSQGFLERSSYHYERCLSERPKDPAIWRAYAAVLSERLDYPGAVAAIKKSLTLDPGNAESLGSLALFEHRQGLSSQADWTLRRAITASKDKIPFRLERALWLLDANDLDGSWRETQQVLQESPDNPLGRWVRAFVSLRRGNRDEAIQDLRLAASKGEQFPFIASAAQAMLEQLGVRP